MNRAQLSSWYTSQTPRDQRVLQAGGVLLVLIVLAGIFLPLQGNLRKAEARLKLQQTDLAWMRQVVPTLAAAGPGPVAVTTPDSLMALVGQSTREQGLGDAFTGSQPGANGATSVQLSRGDFNNITSWLARLSAQHGVRVEAASFTSSGAPGLVNATLQLHVR